MDKLESEILKIDVKFSPPKIGGKPELDFLIMYSHPTTVDEDYGIAVCVHKFKPDTVYNSTNLAVYEEIYKLSLDGLEKARKAGIEMAKKLYKLPKDIKVVEVKSIPFSGEGLDYDNIYRISMASMANMSDLESAVN